VLISDIRQHIRYALILLAIFAIGAIVIQSEQVFFLSIAGVIAFYIAYAYSKLLRFKSTVDKVVGYIESYSRPNAMREIDQALAADPLPECVVSNGWVIATNYIDGLEFAPIDSLQSLTISERNSFFDLKAVLRDGREIILGYDEESDRAILRKILSYRPDIPLDPKRSSEFARIM
jgi:hypothetical protein